MARDVSARSAGAGLNVKRDPQARLVVRQLKPRIVQLGHRVDQAQAQAAAGRRALRVQAHETLLGMLALLGGDTRPGVG